MKMILNKPLNILGRE